MTFLEKALEMETDKSLTKEDIIHNFCPSGYGLEDDKCNLVDRKGCKKCWNREMPNTEPKEDDLQEIKEAMAEAYADGQNDIWELVRKIYDKKCDEIEKIFDVDGGFWAVIRDFTPQEALTKLKAYEEAQSKIEVGDVVFCSLVAEDDNDTENKDNYGVVAGIYRDHYEILMKNGDTTGFKKETCKKTGKHIDIQSILEQIGE